MTYNPLGGVEAKIRRADEHWQTLRDASEAFIDSNPYSMVLEHVSDLPVRYAMRAKVTADPPVRLGVIVGDYVNNLRSALDHLVWQIVIAHGEHAPTRRTAFPITFSKKDFTMDVIRPRRRGKKSPLLGVDRNSLRIIEKVQPYKGRKRRGRFNAFGVLSELSNVDKHQVVHASIAAMTDQEPNIVGAGFGAAEVRWGPVVVTDGAQLGTVTFHGSEPPENLALHGTFAVEMCFGEMRIPGHRLVDLRNAVVSLVNRWGPSFGYTAPAAAAPSP